MKVARWLVMLAGITSLAGCGWSGLFSASQPSIHSGPPHLLGAEVQGPPVAIHARHGRYTVRQVEQAFALVGLRPSKITRTVPGATDLAFGSSSHPIAAVLVFAPNAPMTYATKTPRYHAARRRNVLVFYRTPKSPRIQFVLTILR
jgi:hypothetical protein